MKIEIGAGTKGLEGYVHVDAVALEGVDVVDDGRTLETFQAGIADEIYCHWFLEHVASHEVPGMLSAWKRVLRSGGKVQLITNNHEAHNRCLHEREISWDEWEYLVYAVRTKVNYSVWDVHKSAWNQDLLKATLEDHGFVEVSVRAQWQCREKDGRLKCPALVAVAYKP